MKIRIFGDSWAWTWVPNNFFKSTKVTEAHGYNNGFSVMKSILSDMGYDVIIHNQPGKGVGVTETFVNREAKHRDQNISESEVWLIMVSNTTRQTDQNDWDFSSIDNFIDRYDEITLKSLQSMVDVINNAPNTDNVQYLFMGAHVGLPKYLFDRIENKPSNVHLFSENILYTLHESYDCLEQVHAVKKATRIALTEYNNEAQREQTKHDLRKQMVRLFYADEDIFGRFCDDHKKLNKPVDKDLVDYMYHVYEARTNPEVARDPLKYPDTGHLGPVGHLYFCDYLLKFLEDLET